MWLWSRAFALVNASVAWLFFFAQPLVGALLGVLLLVAGIGQLRVREEPRP